MNEKRSMLKKTRPITNAEHRRILAQVESPEIQTFMDLLFQTGARPLDLANLTVNDVNWAMGWLEFASRKSGLITRISLRGGARKLLATQAHSGPLFPGLFGSSLSDTSRIFRKTRGRAGIEPTLNIHSYRLRILKSFEKGRYET